MSNVILVLNAGSSSLKFGAFLDTDPPKSLLRGRLEGLLTLPRFVARDDAGSLLAEKEWPSGTQLGHDGAIQFLFDWGRDVLSDHQFVAVGHRVVHGGLNFTCALCINPAVLAELEDLIPLAPLHQPHNLAAIKEVAKRAPNLPQVACFDTSFHRTQPAIAQTFALPKRFADQGVIRYGFHGLSYEYIASALAEIDPRAAAGRTIVAHLGNGASMCALRNSKSVASTMGFSSLEGLPMGTRCGSIDPGVLLYLMDRHNMDARALEKLLYQESGLLGVSGISSDIRALLASSTQSAAEALDLFTYRIGRELGSLVAALGGLDAIVFTGGIGENAGSIRARVCQDAAWLGIDLDSEANLTGQPRISRIGSHVTVWVIPTDEERLIARHTHSVLAQSKT
jgi:acetate kinase